MNTYIIKTVLVLLLAGALSSCLATREAHEGKKLPLPDLPVLYMENFMPLEDGTEDSTYTAYLRIFANSSDWLPGEGKPGFLSEIPILNNQKITLRIRGQSSRQAPKKTFALNLVDEEKPQVSVSRKFLNFPKESDFVLHSAYFNYSLLPNYLTYIMSNEIGVWAPRVALVEVYGSQLEDTFDIEYQGIYVLTEKVKRDDKRVDLQPLTSVDNQLPEITGGYLLKNDKLSPGDLSFTTEGGQRIIFEYPKADKVTPAQQSYIREYFNAFERSTLTTDPKNPEAFGEFIDPNSFADALMMTEAIGNVDGLKYSSFMSKDRGGKLKAGPLWDNDLSMGQTSWGNSEESWEVNEDFTQWTMTNSWYIVHSENHPTWWKKMLRDPAFFQRVRDRWIRMHNLAFNETHVNTLVDQALKKMGVRWDPVTQNGTWGHFAANAQRWTWEELESLTGAFPGTVIYGAEGMRMHELNFRYLKAWLKARFEWLNQDSTWDQLKVWALDDQVGI